MIGYSTVDTYKNYIVNYWKTNVLSDFSLFDMPYGTCLLRIIE